MNGRLPLFPLPLVLVPEALLPLHIFEARYRRMVARCLEYDRRFGLVYHDPDRSGPFLMEDGPVGCVAEIDTFKLLPDGRSLILTQGAERFRVRDGLETDEPYYEAVVEPYEDVDVPPESVLRARRARSLELFRAAVESLGPEEDPEVPDLDVDRELSFRLAAALKIDADWHQSFLELRSEPQRLERLDAIFQVAARRGGSASA
jgi:Lon protease-like protein